MEGSSGCVGYVSGSLLDSLVAERERYVYRQCLMMAVGLLWWWIYDKL